MKRLSGILLLCSLLFFNDKAVGQDWRPSYNRDTHTWLSAGMRYKLSPKFIFSAEQELRMDSFGTQLDQYFTQLEGTWKFLPKWSITVGARHIHELDNTGNEQGFEQHFRFHIDLQNKFKVGSLTFSNRLRYQNRNELGRTQFQGDYTNIFWRYKNSVEWNIKDWKLDPKLSYELFLHRQIGALNGFTQYRISLATTYNLNKKNRLKFMLFRERENRLWNPKTTYTLAIKYQYTLKRKSKAED